MAAKRNMDIKCNILGHPVIIADMSGYSLENGGIGFSQPDFLPKVKGHKIRSITIICDGKVLVEADGELLGKSPVSFYIVPSVLTVVL
ncbi:hypothetical protein ACFLYF_00305 [Chloroflexota bacterium]